MSPRTAKCSAVVGHVTADGAVQHYQLRVVGSDASARVADANVTANRAVTYRNYPAVGVDASAAATRVVNDDAIRYRQCSTTTKDEASSPSLTASRIIAADDAVRNRQPSATIAVDAAAVGAEGRHTPGIVADDSAAGQCEASMVKDATPPVVVRKEGKAIRDGDAGDGDVRRCMATTDGKGRQFWVVAAERENAGRFIVRADEKLSAFVELERGIHEFAVSLIV